MTLNQDILRLAATQFAVSMAILLIGVARIDPQESVSDIDSETDLDTGALEDSGADPCDDLLGEDDTDLHQNCIESID